jgi:hypothetical protein
LVTGQLAISHEKGGIQRLLALAAYPPFLLLQHLMVPFAHLGDETVLSYVAVLRRRG